MRRFVIWVMLAWLAASASALADSRQKNRQRADRGAPPAERIDEGNWRDDARRRRRDDAEERYRLSDEERAQLRRDIEEAGRDVYRRPRRR